MFIYIIFYPVVFIFIVMSMHECSFFFDLKSISSIMFGFYYISIFYSISNAFFVFFL